MTKSTHAAAPCIIAISILIRRQIPDQAHARSPNQRTLRQHTSDELKSQKAQEAEDIRKRALKQRDDDLVRAVKKLDLGNETVPPYETKIQDNSRIDRIKRMVSAISIIADQVSVPRRLSIIGFLVS